MTKEPEELIRGNTQLWQWENGESEGGRLINTKVVEIKHNETTNQEENLTGKEDKLHMHKEQSTTITKKLNSKEWTLSTIMNTEKC